MFLLLLLYTYLCLESVALTSIIYFTSLIPFPFEFEFNLVFFVHDNMSVCFNLPGEIRV